MKTKAGAGAFLLSLALTILTGCSMNDKESGGLPSAGTATTNQAARTAEKISSELYDLIGVKGEASDTRPGVSECAGKDPAKYFTVFHPWTFTPTSPDQLKGVMERLREELPKHGWKVVEYGPDTSKNENLTITADNDGKKYGVKIAYFAKDARPNLNLFLTSGCYQVPDGQTVEKF
ncbi:hypothetical protein RGF97_20350 [Streptomyces roseicoloratus]|uniref:Lipoprotein n=1 Tax=Streptomyces roseicoloratus TaxID=2508722 RepID=A0ABY9RYE0_9ACTN|nr:hypothetical protein [Streptomyces roseicoloratus]WMX46708.1 hypothetical protein RGF97_20350 [Streptomyces roseicoloratus]